MYYMTNNGVAHGRPQKFFQRGKSRHFAYPFQVADDAVRMDVHKTFYPFNTITKMPRVTATVPKMRFVGSNASFSLMRLLTP